MRTLNSYSPLQQQALTRFGRLKMLRRDVLPKLDASDFRVKLTLKALYSTYRDLEDLGASLARLTRLREPQSGLRGERPRVPDSSGLPRPVEYR